MTFLHHAQLATWRARVGPSEELCLALFGIGRETLQRIESGEIEPEADIAERIRLELQLVSEDMIGGAGSPHSAAPGRRCPISTVQAEAAIDTAASAISAGNRR